jgi:putative membrane protein
MMFRRSRYFSPQDLERISAAVREAEQKTSGEIVPYFVRQSDRYEEAVWRGAAFLAFTVLGGVTMVRLFTDVWLPLDTVELALLTMGAGGVGALLVGLIPPLKRFLSGDELIDRRVALRAADAFISEEVFRTRDRTGILIFLSLLEHKVLVVGDVGINAKVDRSEWEDVVARIVRGVNAGTPVEGLIDAIRQCGVLLERHGVKIRRDDRNELSNVLRTEKRARKPRR